MTKQLHKIYIYIKKKRENINKSYIKAWEMVEFVGEQSFLKLSYSGPSIRLIFIEQ